MSQSQDVLQVECLGLEGLKNTTRQFHDLMSSGNRWRKFQILQPRKNARKQVLHTWREKNYVQEKDEGQTLTQRVRQKSISTVTLCTHFVWETFKSAISFVVNQLSKSTKSYNSYDASPTAQYTSRAHTISTEHWTLYTSIWHAVCTLYIGTLNGVA